MPLQRDKFESWKYLVDDFLEIACFLNEAERGFLIEKINLPGADEEKVAVHTAFSISGKLIVLAEEKDIQELWIYDNNRKEVKCFKWVEVPAAEKQAFTCGRNHSNTD